MRTSTPSGPHLPFGDSQHRIAVSGIILMILALLLFLMAFMLSAPHTVVLSLVH